MRPIAAVVSSEMIGSAVDETAFSDEILAKFHLNS
jgi:hypothetical protein